MCALAVFALFVRARAQAPDTFEVAAIRLHRDSGGNTDFNVAKGRFSATSATLKTLVRTAYAVLDSQISGGPAWFDTDKYDIEARTTAPEELTFDRIQPLLRNLLAERFRLRVHRETRQMPVYALSVDKGGVRFAAAAPAESIGMNTRKGPGTAKLTATKIPLSLLATNLGNQLGRVVIDKTGLAGNYDLTLQWDPDQSGESASPSLFTALREQLGLRLESRKGPVEMLVIDGAERPSDN